ncbi:tryptophan synthase beta subunit-like PLP-dependent enzyme [Lipomyces kononenkoae]|uniref:Tryptophan synthase beta subunit-like PLP-dependent enzyme n=1 Tax=Lipomyces kononenkoae TaxID=34357 RepID=A0ACC3T6B9_LIPKO
MTISTDHKVSDNSVAYSTPYIRTPLVYSRSLSKITGSTVLLKLEVLQPSGSFKSRGVGHLVFQALLESPQGIKPHIYSSSGGNAGCAAALAAKTYGCPCTVVVPSTVAPHMVRRLSDTYGANVISHGSMWSEADARVRQMVNEHRGSPAKYCPPFDDPLIWEGNSTMIDEIMEQLTEAGYDKSKLKTISCSVGGGGLFCGLVAGLKRHYPSSGEQPVITAAETYGAESLNASLKAGELVTLPAITSIASSLGADRVASEAFDAAMTYPTMSVVVSDAQAVGSCLKILDEHRLFVEPACGAALAPWYYSEKYDLRTKLNLEDDSISVIVVCGGSTLTLDSILHYRNMFKDEL